MINKRTISLFGSFCLIFVALFLAGCSSPQVESAAAPRGIRVEQYAEYPGDPSCAENVEALRQAPDANAPIYDRYETLPVMDAHYHGAAVLIPGPWKKYHISRTDLFWAISEPRARLTDTLTWWAYRLN